MRNLMKRFCCISACLVSLASVANAGSVVLYDNLLAATDGADPVNSFGPLADSFSTGGSATTLTDVQVNLTFQGSPNPAGQVTVYLLADSSTSPGPVLDTLGTVSDAQLSPPPGSSTIVDIPGLSIALGASTRYWIELVDTTPLGAGGTSIYWNWSLDTSGTGVANEYLSNQNGVFPNAGNGPYQMLVQGVTSGAIPEPSSAVLLGLGLGGGFFAFGRARKARRAAA
jgi:hypothetical protein